MLELVVILVAFAICVIVYLSYKAKYKNALYTFNTLNNNLYSSIHENCKIVQDDCDKLIVMTKSAKAQRIVRQMLLSLDYMKIDTERHKKEVGKLL